MLMQKHQNMNLKLKALKGEKIATMTNPDMFIKTYYENEFEQDVSKPHCEKNPYEFSRRNKADDKKWN